MNYIVKVKDERTNSSRHFTYKTYKGAKNRYEKEMVKEYITVEIYEQISIGIEQLSLFEERRGSGSVLPY